MPVSTHAALLSAIRPLVLAAIAGVAFVAGCTNPIGRSAMDTDQRVSLARLRTVQTLPTAVRTATAPEGGGDPVARGQEARDRFAALERVELSLEDARAATLENNLSLRATLVSPTIAEENLSAEEGAFNAVFTLGSSYAFRDDATATALASGESESGSITPGLRIPLRTGGEATIRVPVGRSETDNQFATLNPAVSADLELSLSHNLLRGAGRRATTHQIRLADYNLQISQAQAKLEVVRQLAAVERAYWRLYAAIRVVEVREQQYELAVEQLNRADRRFEAGTIPEVDVIRGRSGAADRVSEIIAAQNAVTLAQRELKQIVNIAGLGVDTPTAIEPVSPPDPIEYIFDPEQLVAAAVENRAELLELEIQLARDAAQVAFAKNQSLPLLALSYTYRINGLAGTAGDAFEVLEDNNFEDFEVGLNAEIPLGNEQRRSQLAAAILTRLQRLSTRDARRQAIEREVYDAMDNLGSSWQRILAGQQAVLLNARTLDAERRQFDVGRSTSTDVLDVDTRLAESRLAEIQAVVDYQIAQVDLAFATGTMLGASRVTWEPVDPRGGKRVPMELPPAYEGDAPTSPRYTPIDGVFTGPSRQEKAKLDDPPLPDELGVDAPPQGLQPGDDVVGEDDAGGVREIPD